MRDFSNLEITVTWSKNDSSLIAFFFGELHRLNAVDIVNGYSSPGQDDNNEKYLSKRDVIEDKITFFGSLVINELNKFNKKCKIILAKRYSTVCICHVFNSENN